MYFKKLVIAAILMSTGLVAQEQTLLGRGMNHGVYGSGGLQVSQVNGQTAYLSTSQLVWLINHRYSLGLGGYNLVASVEGPQSLDTGNRFIDLDMGGVEMGYIFGPNKLIHGAFRVLASVGQVSYHYKDLDSSWKGEENFITSISPSVDFMMNVTSFLHLSITARYRLVNGVDLDGLTDADLSGPSVGAGIQIGKF